MNLSKFSVDKELLSGMSMKDITIKTSDGITKKFKILEADVQSYLDGLPENIRGIIVNKCNLTYISNLSRFTNLEILDCSDNQLKSLPELPESLTELYCGYNQLISLPELPESLTELYCYNNQLISLPNLQKNLIILWCSNNQLISLPELPENLEELQCYNNLLTSLPDLQKSLNYLACSDNQITSITELPNSLYSLYWENNHMYDILEDLSIICRHIPSDNAINILNRFRHVYYYLRFKIKFIQWFLRTKKAKIMVKTTVDYPDKIIELLDSGVDVLDLEQYI